MTQNSWSFVKAPGCFAETWFATPQERDEFLGVKWQTSGLHKIEGVSL